MTVLETGERHDRAIRRGVGHTVRSRTRPGPGRPPAGVTRHRGTGVRMPRAVHRARPVSAHVTVAVAGLAALITVWLGAIGQARTGDAAPVPERLAVVQVQAGESLQQIAARMVPEAPVGRTVDRIRELNDLKSAAVNAGQTLVTPVG